jgi:hypothetical protein
MMLCMKDLRRLALELALLAVLSRGPAPLLSPFVNGRSHLWMLHTIIKRTAAILAVLIFEVRFRSFFTSLLIAHTCGASGSGPILMLFLPRFRYNFPCVVLAEAVARHCQ